MRTRSTKTSKFPISCLSFSQDKRCHGQRYKINTSPRCICIYFHLSDLPTILVELPTLPISKHLTPTSTAPPTTTSLGRAIMSNPNQPDQTKYKLCYFVPPSSLQATKTAIFATNFAGVFASPTDASKILYTNVVCCTSALNLQYCYALKKDDGMLMR